MKSPAWIHALVVSALCAAAVWALSPLLTGHKEPWDSPGYYYLAALALAGLVAGFASPRIIWALLVGSVVGQFLYEIIFLKTGPLVAVGVVFMFLYGMVFVAAAMLAANLRKRIFVRD